LGTGKVVAAVHEGEIKSQNTLEILEERGFVEKTTDDEALRELLEQPVTCYIGFDPTASSLQVGNLVQIMSLVHMQRGGHRPIALVGAGTALIGDPSGRIEARRILTRKTIDENGASFKKQLSQYLDFTEDRTLLLNNADWLVKLNYIEFLRDFGVHFSVNRMLSYESIKTGLERGLSFIEFNYQCLQAYDFWYQFKHCGCVLQMGGSDQWGNIVAGIDLIRRLEGRQAYGIVTPLIETADGKKMGKTAEGTIWLDAQRTSPYDYYQFWINVDDRDVERFLGLFTFLPIDEVRSIRGSSEGVLNTAKTVLAFEATRIAHGLDQAIDTWKSASAAFGKRVLDASVLPSSELHRIDREHSDKRFDARSPEAEIPTTVLEKDSLDVGIPAFELFHRVGLCRSGSEARRLITQGGGYVNQKRVEHFGETISSDRLVDGVLILKAGKKRVHRVRVEG
jgi:tyrosyl-tRNA synthetase